VCVGESWPLVASVSVTSESVEEWDATGTRDEGEGRLADTGGGDATLVRHENFSELGEWYGELGGTGTRDTKTPRGKLGARKRIYHPRKGRCISHNTFDVALSTTWSMISLSDKTWSLNHMTRSLFSSATLTLFTDKTSELCTVYLTVWGIGDVGIEACMVTSLVVVVISKVYSKGPQTRGYPRL